jgi:AraC family transcriptional regulator
MDPLSDTTHISEYRLRLNRCIDYIQHHYGETLNLSRLAEVACFSKFHFHRIFRALMGETVNDCIQRVRLEKATYKLIFDKDQSITDIALACGFSSSQNFARCFKAHYGATPTRVRAEYNWNAWAARLNALKGADGRQAAAGDAILDRYLQQHQITRDSLLASPEPMAVAIRQMPALRVAYVRSRGPYRVEQIASAFGKVLQWARPKGLMERQPLVLGVLWSSLDITPREKLLYDACIAVPEAIKADRWVNIQTLKGGTFGVYRCEIESGRHEEAWMRLILNWLVSSDYQPDDRPGYEIYYSASTSDPLGRAVVELCLPVKPLKG